MLNKKYEKTFYDTIMRAVTEISSDVKKLLEDSLSNETNETAKSMLSSMLENLSIAKSQDKAICQSPGYPTAWIIYGDDNFPDFAENIIKKAILDATKKGYLRPSIVDPLSRYNPGDNTGQRVPNIEYEYVPGQNFVDFIISFKGCGAELGNSMKIFTPAALRLDNDYSGLKKFVLETVINAGGKPCPPYGIGIGIGGQMDIAAKLSRKAISTRMWDDINPDPKLAELEKELYTRINSLGLGSAGTGGDRSCLSVKIETAATHTAIAPIAVNFHCWVARRAGIRIHSDGKTNIII